MRQTASRATLRANRRPVPIAAKRLQTADGVELTYYSAGKRDGVPLVLCNGLGGNVVVWRPLFRHFARRFRVITWDYRGLFASGPAGDPSEYSMAHHVSDLLDLLEHEGVESPVLVGWSMGVQLSLEVHRTHPDLARAIVAIHGTPGMPLRTAFDSSLTERLAPGIFDAMRAVGRGLRGIGPYLARSRLVAGSFVWAGQRLGVMAPSLDLAAFQELAEQWVQLDMRAYADIFEQVCDHDAEDLLADLRVPALVIVGDRDRFTPGHVAQRMVEAMPDACLDVIPGATHFGLLEFPDAIVVAIERYLYEKLGIDC